MRELRILLVGKTGSGKSSVGNTILGQDIFKVAHSTQSCTTTYERAEAIRDGTKYVVVDTPGIHDTHTSTIQQLEAFIYGCIATSPGFHIIAFVLKRGDKYTAEIQETQRIYFEWFGNDVDSFSCLIMTHTKDDAEKELYIADPHNDFKLLLERTHGNLVIFENKGASHEREKQVDNCINLFDCIVARNNEKCFESLLFYLLNVMKENFDIDDIFEYIKQRLGSKFKDDGFAKVMSIVESLADAAENEPQSDTNSIGRLIIVDENQCVGATGDDRELICIDSNSSSGKRHTNRSVNRDTPNTNRLKIYNEDNTRYQPNLDNATKSRDSQFTARSENCTASIEPRTASIEDNPQHHTPEQKQLQAKDPSADRLGMNPEEEANTSFVHTSSSDYFGKKSQTDESESMSTNKKKRTPRSERVFAKAEMSSDEEEKNTPQGCMKSSEEITGAETGNRCTALEKYTLGQIINFLKWIWFEIKSLFQNTPLAQVISM